MIFVLQNGIFVKDWLPCYDYSMKSESLLESLKARGLIYQISNEKKLKELLGSNRPITFYWGTDVTAKSFHLGHLVSFNLIRFLQKAGLKPIILLGGGTTLIGDPSGREKSRPILSEEEIQKNTAALKGQLSRFVEFDQSDKLQNSATIVNNIEWLGGIDLMRGYLREFAPYFSVNEMISWETWKNRLKSNEGISLMEFVYNTLQAIDFYQLYQKYNCLMQIGGSDQWLNLLSGVELIRKKSGTEALAVSTPLLIGSEGRKMGKTGEGKTVWLDENLFSPYEMYQYLRNRSDKEVETMLKLLTPLELSEISEIMKQNPVARLERLAFEITALVHGVEKAKQAERDSKAAFGGQAQKASAIPTIEVNQEAFKNDEVNLIDLLVENKILASRSEVRRLIEGGGVRLNQKTVSLESTNLAESDFTDNQAVLGIGKKKIVRVFLVN